MIITTPVTKSALIEQIVDEFAPRFVPNGVVRCVAGRGWARRNPELIGDLGLTAITRRRMPDVLLHQSGVKRLVLIDASTGQGVITETRRGELARMYFGSRVDLIIITAFQSRAAMSTSVEEIAWGTIAWIADESTRLISFNGDKFLGPSWAHQHRA